MLITDLTNEMEAWFDPMEDQSLEDIQIMNTNTSTECCYEEFMMIQLSRSYLTRIIAIKREELIR